MFQLIKAHFIRLLDLELPNPSLGWGGLKCKMWTTQKRSRDDALFPTEPFQWNPIFRRQHEFGSVWLPLLSRLEQKRPFPDLLLFFPIGTKVNAIKANYNVLHQGNDGNIKIASSVSKRHTYYCALFGFVCFSDALSGNMLADRTLRQSESRYEKSDRKIEPKSRQLLSLYSFCCLI